MSSGLKLGSLFDGSGGFPLAGSLCGIKPVWASEVEPYPIAVTTSRFPDMKHLGDISRVSGADIEPVDIITFGSPCQDLSIAGKRAGLKHESNGDEETTRSGLFMEAVRIIKEMREATNGRYPRIALWENVPGAFSSNKGADFRIVLEELIRIVEPYAAMPKVPKAGWNYADCFSGDGWSLAYRVFDAQHWGVPQRRRRIHLVLHLTGGCAGEILFERKGLRGDFAEGRKTWQATAGDVAGCVGTADCERKCVAFSFDALASNSMKSSNPHSGCRLVETAKTLDCFDPSPAKNQGGIAVLQPVTFEPGIAQRQGGHIYDGVSGTLRANAGDNQVAVAYQASCILESAGFCTEHSAQSRGVGYEKETSPTLRAGVVPAVVAVENHPADSRVRIAEDGKVQTITSRMGTGGGNVPLVMVPYTLKIRSGCEGGGKGALVQTDKSATLSTLNDQYLFQPIPIHDQATRFSGMRGDKADGKGNGLGVGSPGDPMNSLTAGDRHAVFYSFQRIGELAENTVASTQIARQYKDSTDLVVEGDRVNMIVRRLTPTECARLQGFPDDWGIPATKEDLTDEEYHFWLDVRNTHARINGREEKVYSKAQLLSWYNKLHTDSAEYKMWGNGIALPPALYCMQGIVDAIGG